jgi:MoxR-like ATPase
VTVDGNTYTLPEPFLVIATQNPIEYEGTFPLPEAQLDRFMLKIELGYPSLNDETLVLDLQQIRHPIRDLEPVIHLDELLAAQEYVKKVFVSPAVKRYIVELVRATRNHSDVYLGSSPRGSLALYKTGQVKAAMEGRNYVTPDDIQYLTQYALPHRIMLNPAARLRNLSANQVLEEVIINTKVVGKDFEPEEKA